MKKYCIIDNCETKRAAQYEEVFESKEEALEAAENEWSRFTKHDKNDRDEYYVAECEVDEDGCIDVIDIIKDYKNVERGSIYNELVSKLEQRFGDLNKFEEECVHEIGQRYIDGKVISDNECLEGEKLYAYILSGDKLYKAYYDVDGEQLEDLDSVDFSEPTDIEEVEEL